MYAVNSLPAIDQTKSTTGCCTLINPADWDDKTFIFNNKLFAKTSTRSLFHVPINMSSVMTKSQALIDEADARSDEFIILSHESSPWHADQYFAVDREVPGMETVRLSGEFMTKVFEGEYKNAQSWYKQLIEFVKSKGKQPLKTFFFYTTCPDCSKKYGKNYVVGFEQVA